MFKLLNKVGRKKFTENFILISCNKHHLLKLNKPIDQNLLYLGIKVSKKIGSAPVRNKIKRRIRHVLRELSVEHNFVSQTACVLIPRKSCYNMAFDNLKASILASIVMPQK